MSQPIILVSDPAPRGLDGRTILHGEGAPTAEIGNVGDWYVDTENGLFYGAKQPDGSWGDPIVIGNVAFASQEETDEGEENDKAISPETYQQGITNRIASNTEAVEGTNNTKLMTPLRVAQAIEAMGGGVSFASQAETDAGSVNNKAISPQTYQQGITNRLASEAEAEAGTNATKLMTPERTAQAIAALAQNLTKATTEQAEAGTDDTAYMTPQKTAQAISALGQNLSLASESEATSGTDNIKYMSSLRTAQAIAAMVSGASLGSGANVYKERDGSELRFRSLVAGANVSIAENANTIEIAASGGVEDGQNIWGGSGVFKDKDGANLRFKTLVAGANVAITETTDEITISASGGGGGGESNDGANVGTGAGVYKDKSGVTLNFRRLKAGANISVTENSNDITISGIGGAGADVRTGSILDSDLIITGSMMPTLSSGRYKIIDFGYMCYLIIDLEFNPYGSGITRIEINLTKAFEIRDAVNLNYTYEGYCPGYGIITPSTGASTARATIRAIYDFDVTNQIYSDMLSTSAYKLKLVYLFSQPV